MKRYFIPFIFCLGFIIGKAQTATDFTATDCNGNSYNLFTDLDAGKVVVITWTMPCGACVSGALTAYNISQSYEATYPGKVIMLLADDFGNTPCSAINSWGNAYGLARAIKFSDPSIRMSDYGITGMPKTVALAPDHSVIFNQNNSVDPDSLQAAIDAVLTATVVKELPTSISKVSLFPNPAGNRTTLELNLTRNSNILVKLFDVDGKRIQTAYDADCFVGENLIPLDLAELNDGVYHVLISDGNSSKTLQLLVSH